MTLFATADSDHDRAAAQHVTARVERGRLDRAQGRRGAAHRHRLRARRRPRHHPQRLRLPAAHLQRARRHAGRHDDPRLLVAADPARRTSATTTRRRTSRSATPTATRRCTTPPRSTTASTPTPSPSTRTPVTTCCSSAGSTRTRAPPHAIDVAARAGRRLVIAGIIHDQRYFDEQVAPHVDGDRVRYIGPVDRRRPFRRARGGARAPAPHRLRRTVRLQRRRGDGMRHTRHRPPPRLDARAHHRRRHGLPRRRRRRGRPSGRRRRLARPTQRSGRRPSTASPGAR